MIFNNGTIYGKVWKVTRPTDENGNPRKYIELQISTYEKQNDEYVYSSWFPRVIGHAFNSLANIKEGDNIAITKSKFTNEKYTDKDGNTKSAFRFLVLEAKIEDKNTKNATESTPSSEPVASTQPASEATTEEDPW